jgi:hypothetical protein
MLGIVVAVVRLGRILLLFLAGFLGLRSILFKGYV